MLYFQLVSIKKHTGLAGEKDGLQNRSGRNSRVEFDSLCVLHMSLITSNQVNVTVAGQVYTIPAEKVQQVLNLLASIQSVQVENPTPYLKFNGKSLING